MDEDGLAELGALWAQWSGPTPVGTYWDVVDARSPRSKGDSIRFGVTQDTFDQYLETVQKTVGAHYYGIVRPGLVGAQKLYVGLERDLMHGDDMHADQDVMVYVWQPPFDFVWEGSRQIGLPKAVPVPPQSVFVTLVRGYTQPDEHGISGAVLRWSWFERESAFDCAPKDHGERFKTELWTEDQKETP